MSKDKASELDQKRQQPQRTRIEQLILKLKMTSCGTRQPVQPLKRSQSYSSSVQTHTNHEQYIIVPHLSTVVCNICHIIAAL